MFKFEFCLCFGLFGSNPRQLWQTRAMLGSQFFSDTFFVTGFSAFQAEPVQFDVPEDGGAAAQDARTPWAQPRLSLEADVDNQKNPKFGGSKWQYQTVFGSISNLEAKV